MNGKAKATEKAKAARKVSPIRRLLGYANPYAGWFAQSFSSLCGLNCINLRSWVRL